MKYFSFIVTLLVICFSWSISSNIASAANASILSLSPVSGSYQVGQAFSIDVNLDTQANQVTAVSTIISYDKTKLSATSLDVISSAFSKEVENTIDATNGKIYITRGQPTPGVSGSAVKVARVNFSALATVTASSVSISFTSAGASGDSGVILNDATGTDILTSVVNASFDITSTADIIAPSVPSGVSAVATTNSATISWTASTDSIGVAGYGIYRNNVAIASSTQASYTDSGLTPATTYSYSIDAYDAAGNASAKSTAIQALTQSAADITSPVISSAQASTATNMATVSWTTDDLADSQVEYGITSSYGLTTALDNALTFSHSQILSGLTPNTTYNYRVISKDQAGNVAMSSNYTFATAAIADTTPPTSITNLSVSDISQTSVKLSWMVPSDASGVSIYDIRYSTANITSSNFSSAAQVSSIPTPAQSGTTQQHYVSVGLTPGTTYYFAIISKDSIGNASQISNIPSTTTLSAPPVIGGGGGGGGSNYQISDTTPPNSPSNIKATAFDTQIALSWTNPTDPDFVRVKILRKTGSDPSSSSDGTVIYEGESKTFTDTKLQNDTKYYYAIYAHDKVPNFSSPARISATPKVSVVITTPTSTSTVPSLLSVQPTPKLPAGVNEGDLVRGPDGIKVYIVNQHGYRRHIFNPAIFNMYGHFKWDQIKTVDQQTLDSMPASDFYRADIDQKVFSLKELDESKGVAQKRWMNVSGDRFIQLGYKWEQVFIINTKERDYYQEGTALEDQELAQKSISTTELAVGSLVKTSEDATIYFITGLKAKKPILNADVFNSYPLNKWQDVKIVSHQTLSKYPTIKAIKLQNDQKIYFLDWPSKQKRWIKTSGVLTLLGVKSEEIITVNQTEFNAYPEGSALE